MFSVHCPAHGSEVLLTERHIVALRPKADGHELHWRCFCGTEGTSVVSRLAA